MHLPPESVKQDLAAGAGYGVPVRISRRGAHPTVTAIPGAGGTMDVQYSTSRWVDVQAGAATWQAWPSGSVASITNDTLLGNVTAIRARAVTQPGVLEVCQ